MNHWNWRQRSIAIVIWPSFLAACLGTLLFFAAVDATVLPHTFVLDLNLSQQAIYSLGFFLFWMVAAVGSALSTWLIRTERRRAEFPVIEETEVFDVTPDEITGDNDHGRD